MNSNENNNNNLYHNDNSFNNQGVVDAPNTNAPVEQTQFPNANKNNAVTNFGKGLALGFKSGLNGNNGMPSASKNNSNNPAKGQKKPNSSGLSENNNNQNNDKSGKGGQNSSAGNNNGNRNPLPGGGTNKKDDRRDKIPKKDNKNDALKQVAKAHPVGRAASIPSRLGLGKKKDKESGSKGAVGNTLNEAGKQGIRKLWIVLPIQAKIAVVTVVPVLLIMFLIMAALFGGTTAALSDDSSSNSYCGSSDYDLSVLDKNPPTYTYTGVFDVEWMKSTAQYKTLTSLKTYADDDGFLRSGDAYLIALGSYFGIEKDGKKELVMGTKYLVKLKNGTEFVGILADAKADKHTTESSQHSQHYKDRSVVEFEMACGSKITPSSYKFNFSGNYNTSCSGVQTTVAKKFHGEIESISLLDDSGASCNYENGEFPIRTEYFSQADLKKIFSVSPGAKSQKQSYPWECVTYAKLRATEILMTATNISDEYKKKAIAAISGTHGNGGDWHAPQNVGLKNFNYDTTCTKPKAGSLISWQSGSSYGHVGIIEAVKGDKVIITDGYNSSHFNYHEISIKQLQNLGSPYYKKCYGITYLFEYNG